MSNTEKTFQDRKAQSERRVIRKWFWVWDYEKEEQWLNRMAMQGWLLVKVGFCKYTFTSCEPGEYIIRLEMHPKDRNYLEFMEEMGASYIGNMVQWIYFCRKAEQGRFDLLSDADSKIAHLERISRLLAAVCALNIIVGVLNSFNPTFSGRMGWANLLCAALLMYAVGRIHGKKEAIEQQRLLCE